MFMQLLLPPLKTISMNNSWLNSAVQFVFNSFNLCVEVFFELDSQRARVLISVSGEFFFYFPIEYLYITQIILLFYLDHLYLYTCILLKANCP